MTWEVSTSACSDLHALVREWCRAHQQAGNLEQAERFAIQVGQLAAECAFECAVEACGTKAGYCGARTLARHECLRHVIGAEGL